jgi:S-(hydroxymethyl)glutathione dehydrogenase/alcohol dehydrogenase
VDLAEPKTGEALVRLVACGVCHTDLFTASGADPSGYVPCVLGHEGAGVVEAVGEGVTSVSVGDHVVTLFAPECGECVHCRDPRTNRCVAIRDQQGLGHLPDGTTRLSRGGEPLRHFMGTSTFAEYTVMPEIALANVPREAPLEGCAPFACGLATGIGAALYTAQVKSGSTCAVFGCGLVGLGAVIGCRLADAGRIIAIDLSEERLAMARHHGATDTRVAGEDVVDWIRAETGGFAADYTFEATGNVVVMRQAVEAAREAWGLATMIGVAGKGETLDIVPRLLITGRRVTGSSFGGVKGRTQVPQLVERWLRGEIDVDSLLSHRLSLDDVNRGFELMEAQQGDPQPDRLRLEAAGPATHRPPVRARGRGRQRPTRPRDVLRHFLRDPFYDVFREPAPPRVLALWLARPPAVV